jgi:serine/threonine-protein kinase RsbT
MAIARSDPENSKCVPIASDDDLVAARREGRIVAEQLGFSTSEATLVATAISELARNIVSYAHSGEIHVGLVHNGNKRGINIIARDKGPGILDISLAMREGYSTSGGLGIGLPGVRRIMDEFDIASDVGRGTTITITKWKR